MTLIFNGGGTSSGGDGGSTSVSFTYPYSVVWIYKRSLLDAVNESGEITDNILKQHFVCNLGQASNFENVDKSSLSCSYNGKTLELYEDTDDKSSTLGYTVGTYDNVDIITIMLIDVIWNDSMALWAFSDFKQHIMGIQPGTEPGPL